MIHTKIHLIRLDSFHPSIALLCRIVAWNIHFRYCPVPAWLPSPLGPYSSALKRLVTKSREADSLLASIHHNLSLAKAASEAVNSCRRREIQLRNENLQLKQEVGKLKERLRALETENGVKQVPLPETAEKVVAAEEDEEEVDIEEEEEEDIQEEEEDIQEEEIRVQK